MPNWCSNTMVISGDDKVIRKLERMIQDASKRRIGVMETLVGIPEDISREEYNNEAWYGANVRRWGTKWDFYPNDSDTDIQFTDRSITIHTATAWSPPTEFCERLSRMYNLHVVLTFAEPGADFAGRTVILDGDTIQNEDHNYLEGIYKLDAEQFWQELGGNLEFYVEDGTAVDEIRTLYDFVDADDLEEIVRMYNEKLEEYSG